jgi:hypothetical protein
MMLQRARQLLGNAGAQAEPTSKAAIQHPNKREVRCPTCNQVMQRVGILPPTTAEATPGSNRDPPD